VFADLDVAVFWRSAGDPAPYQPFGCRGHLVDSRVEERLIRLRGLGRPAQLADELQRGGEDLLGRRRRREVRERSDIAAHEGSLTPPIADQTPELLNFTATSPPARARCERRDRRERRPGSTRLGARASTMHPSLCALQRL